VRWGQLPFGFKRIQHSLMSLPDLFVTRLAEEPPRQSRSFSPRCLEQDEQRQNQPGRKHGHVEHQSGTEAQSTANLPRTKILWDSVQNPSRSLITERKPGEVPQDEQKPQRDGHNPAALSGR